MTSKFRPAGSGWAIIVLSLTRARACRLRPQGPARSAADRLQRVHGQHRAPTDTETEAQKTPSVFNPTYGADAAPAATKGKKKPFILDPLLDENPADRLGN